MYDDFRPLRLFALYLVMVYVLGYGGGWRWGLVTWVKEDAVWVEWVRGLPPTLSDVALHLLRLVGTKKPEPWTKVGAVFTAVFCAGTLGFLVLTARPTWESLPGAAAALPTTLVVAALNAFNEEFTLRAAPLGALEPAVGREQALWVTTFFFGVSHYYGVPYGVVGVLLAGFLGWFLGKSMQETGGFAWAWLIHLLQEVIIFTFLIM